MKRVLPIAALVALVVVAWNLGIFEAVEIDSLRAVVEDAGWWGPLLFVALFGLEGFGVPGFVFMGTAILVWPPTLACLYNFLGAQTAGLVGFSFARWIGRDWVEERLPERFRHFESRLEERGFVTVALIRLLFFLAPPAHWALGLSSVRLRDYLLGSAVGMLPWVVVITYGGGHALGWIAS